MTNIVIVPACHLSNRSYKLDDLCVKNAFPSTLIPALDALLTGLNPCTVLTPLDCFWEGSFIHEPANTLTFQKKECNLDWSHNVSWSNVNISEVMNCLEKDSSNSGIIDVVKKVIRLVPYIYKYVCVYMRK